MGVSETFGPSDVIREATSVTTSGKSIPRPATATNGRSCVPEFTTVHLGSSVLYRLVPFIIPGTQPPIPVRGDGQRPGNRVDVALRGWLVRSRIVGRSYYNL
jgi:hypothetical protein